jgi:predicted transcriptional regulator
MSNREVVIEMLERLPADMPLADIAQHIELLSGIREGREQAARGEGVPVDEVRRLVNAWAAGR